MTSPSEPSPLPADYYLRHFELMHETVLASHAHLFLQSEQTRLLGFREMPRPARKLYVRLLSRRGSLFCAARLCYPKIGDLGAALGALSRAGQVDLDPLPTLGPAPLLELLTVPELSALSRELDLSPRGPKPALLERLLGAGPERLTGLLGRETFVRLVEPELFRLLAVVFFGNLEQDQTELVLVDLRRNAYPPTAVSRAHPLFPTRGDLDAYLRAAEREEEVAQAALDGDRERLRALAEAARLDLEQSAPLPPYRRGVDPRRLAARSLFGAASALERTDAAEAASLYEALVQSGPALAGRAADRLGLTLGRLGRGEEFRAQSLALLAKAPLDDIARHRIALRLHRLGHGPDPRAALRRPPVQELDLESAGHEGPRALYVSSRGPVAIEDAALEALGGDGLYAENHLYTTLFGLLFWDEIFAPLSGMFQHPFQDAPLDMEAEEFCWNRQAALEARLSTLSALDVGAVLAEVAACHAGQRCRGVAWEAFTQTELERAARALGSGLAPLLARIAAYPHKHKAGLPDLLLYEPEGPALVEVKGPGDQVSEEQALWHDHLLRHGLRVRLLRVRRLD